MAVKGQICENDIIVSTISNKDVMFGVCKIVEEILILIY